MQRQQQSDQLVKNNTTSDFISRIIWNGYEYKLVFKREDAPGCEQFIIFVVEKGKVQETLQVVKRAAGTWRVVQPVPEWALHNEDKLSMLIERYNALQERR